nr:NAD(P)H-binding protein [Kibdelosporangium sp. MJ126-NF4]CEL13723.1 hypothetical protein [Kibdelosporangium sp. MJ126-NF4]CTQ99410.1 hypothetical protein [Kibdelosporangium sp. MJ126-NF4]
MTTTTVVLGATGKTGSLVVAGVRAAGHRVRAASRSGVVRFDWFDESTWDAVVTGADAAYLLVPEEALLVAPRFVSFAVERGVRRLVTLTGTGVEELGEKDFLDMEVAVRDSGAQWTVLRPGWFNQNFDRGVFRDALLSGDLRLPAGDGRTPFIDVADIAAVAVAALTEDRHHGRTYELTGPRALSFGEAVATIARVSGRALTYTDIPEEDYVAAQQAAGASPDQAKLAGMVLGQVRRGEAEAVSDAVSDVLGRPAVDFADYAAVAWKP